MQASLPLGSIDANAIAHTNLIVGHGQLGVHLDKALQTHAIELGNGVETFTVSNGVWTVFIAFLGTFGLFLQIDNIAFLQLGAPILLVGIGQFSSRDFNLTTYRLVGISLTRPKIVVVVVSVDGVQPSLSNCWRADSLLACCQEVGGRRACRRGVVHIELIALNKVDEVLGITGIGGIAAGLETVGPSLVVGVGKTEQRAITAAASKKLAVVFKTLKGRVVGAETFTVGIIVVGDGTAVPAMTLDAEVVVAPDGEVATASTAFEQTLGKGDAGRDAITVHLGDGKVFIFVYVCLKSCIATDRAVSKDGREKEKTQIGQKELLHKLTILIGCKYNGKE